MPTYKKPEDVDNELHRLLLTAVPENQYGNKTLSHLAELIGITLWSINKWVRNKRLSPRRANEVVEISKITGWAENGNPIKGEPRVTREQLDPFVYNV